ncbi:emerin [Pseudonaja textilis]|uniref:Emerin n=1 Tax=Pseudonaja textilis TaxID=8673 RepID=A0A670Y4I6_PSETE|nr:emerin [Pseudonaja textilis]
MDEYKGMTDKELIARLKKYSIPHGPVVGSTRKLYERKIYEYETERTQYPSPGGSVSHTEPATSQSYVKETFVSPRKAEDFNYGREALGSTRTYFKEYVPTRQEYYSEYRDEDPSPTESYLSYNYNLPHHEEHSSYASEDTDVNTSEPSRSSYRSYSSLLSHTTSPGTVSARQPIAEPYPYSSSEKDMSAGRDSSSYQSVFQRKSSGLSSLEVKPRRAIHAERQAQEAEEALRSNAETKRYLPLWLQLLVFGLLAAFLVFIYFLEGGADGNPFAKYISQ